MGALKMADRKVLAMAHIRANYHGFIITKTRELAEKIVLDEIINRMIQNGFSKKIWENTKITKITFTGKKVTIYFHSEFFTETGFDVALAREVGTKRHFIEPKKQQEVIRQNNRDYPIKYYREISVKQALSWVQDGKRLFSKGHYVSGIKSLHIIKKTLDEKTPVLQEALNGAVKKWSQDIMKQTVNHK